MSAPRDEFVCRELVELVTPYLEDVLPASERAAIDRHLARCSGCRTYLDQMRQMIRALGQIPHEPIEAQAQDEVLTLFRTWKSEHAPDL